MEGERCRQLSLVLLLGGAAIWGIACNGADSLSPSKVATVRIEADGALALAPGESYHLTAVAADAGGSPIPGISFVWHSDDISIASVDGSGTVTAKGPGSTRIVATAGDVSGDALVSVTIPIARLGVTPASATVTVGKTVQLGAQAEDSDGHKIDESSIVWASGATSVATVTQTGLVTGVAPGSATISATGGGKTTSATITVLAPVAGLQIAPTGIQMRTGDTVRVDATVFDRDGNSLGNRPVIWSTTDPEVGQISASGLLTATGTGTGFVFADAEGQRDSVSFQVQDGVAKITLSPDLDDLTVGEKVDLVATLRSAGGAVLTGREIAWSSNRTDVASVSSSGRVTARAPGTATIVARSEGVEGRTTIEVSDDPDTSDEGAVLVGAGDIGSCIGDGDEATAKLLDRIPGTVFAAGDNVYNSGTAAEFANCYGPTWGRHKARTRPAAGNHEYETPGAAGYFGYFGAAAGDPDKGYYSYEVGSWHIVTLNSNIPARAGTPQAQWLKADLDAHPTQCTAAIWHHPLFSSDSGSTRMHDAWQILYQHGAEIAISGHHHNYERFAPQTADGQLDLSRGLRQFVVGTGGRSLGGQKGASPPGSEIRYSDGFGVLKLTLHADWYQWEFVPVAGTSFTDRGSARCH